MSEKTHIEWTDATWNPITGCSVVSAGCKHCYAMRLAGTRLRHHPSRAGLTRPTSAGPVWTGEVRLNEDWLDQPLRWKRPRRIFVCAHGDLFHESVPDDWIDHVFAVMALTPQHTFQVLTKRPERMNCYLTAAIDVYPEAPRERHVAVWFAARSALSGSGKDIYRELPCPRPGIGPSGIGIRAWPLPNIWLGVSVENQTTADERIPLLLQTPAAVRFISAEPLLGAISFDGLFANPGSIRDGTNALEELDWVIAGGESGPGARPAHPDWFRDLRDQCQAAGVPFFFKQWGEWAPDAMLESGRGDRSRSRQVSGGRLCDSVWMARFGKRRAGRLLDGRTWDEFPRSAP